jgi:hypothetical protein
MLDSPIKFPSSPSSNEDELPSYHSYEVNVSSDDGMSDYSPPWSSEEDPKEEDDADDDGDDFDDSDSDSDFDSPPPKQARLK